jgi:nicotinate dehydrogenase subunit A
MGTVRINGVEYEIPDDDEFRSLLSFLETDLGFTDMHYSCRSGQCGTCMLRVDNRWMKSCILPVSTLDGKDVLTQGEIRRIQAELRAQREAAEAAEAAAGGQQTAGGSSD